MKKKYYILSIFLFATFLIVTVSKININTNKLVASVPSSKERLHFLFTDSREEGDSAEAILVESNGLYGLIDAGNSVEDTLSFDGKTVYNYLKKLE